MDENETRDAREDIREKIKEIRALWDSKEITFRQYVRYKEYLELQLKSLKMGSLKEAP